MKTHEIHILIGCADARDLSQMQVDAVAETRDRYQKEKDIDIDLHILRVPGSFITPDVLHDIRRIISKSQRMTSGRYNSNKYFIHIQTHGHLHDDCDKSYISHIYDLKMVEGSPLNCGMLGATGVGLELEQLLVESKLAVEIDGRMETIEQDHEIRTLLHGVYGYDGYLAGDWIKSIDFLRTHPRQQRAILEKSLSNDPEMARLGIKVTAGLLDYSSQSLIRLDSGQPPVPFWDDTQVLVRVKNRENPDVALQMTKDQKPLAGLICMADPRQSSRVMAAKWYLDSRGVVHEGDYMPNVLFNISGSSFDMPDSPFGPYAIAGFYYAVKYLALKDHMVLGYDKKQTARIMIKIKNDPIMNLVVRKFKVNLIPLFQVELAKKRK